METIVFGPGEAVVPYAGDEERWPDRVLADDELRDFTKRAPRKTVAGLRAGPFLVNETFYAEGVTPDSARWTVTHTLTGLAVARKIPSRLKALGLAVALLAEVAEDKWRFNDSAAGRRWDLAIRQKIRALVAEAECR